MKDTKGNSLSLHSENQCVYLVKNLTSEKNLNESIESWNLQALESIQVIDSIGDDLNRKKAEFKRRRKNNVITWGIIGGILDGSSGDDSVLDGVVLGGLFGAATTGAVGKPEARVLLTFTNGDKLGVIVNQDELLEVMEVKQVENLIDGKIVSALTKAQKEAVINARRAADQTNYFILGVLCLVCGFVGNAILGGMVELEDGSTGAILLKIYTFGLGIVGVGFFLMGADVIGKKSKESFLKNGEKL